MGTIVMASAKVIEAADTTIQLILDKRKESDEKRIARYIEHKTPSKFWKRFGFKTPSREQAVKKLSEDIWGFFPCQNGWGDLEKAKKLRKLAEHGDPVTLNEEDVRVLF